MDNYQMTKGVQRLLDVASTALQNSYSPYSSFKVGAAVVSSDGEVFSGTNIENASYSLTICAERVAIFKAIAAGKNKIDKIAVVAHGPDGQVTATPCGACRQVMIEFMDDDAVVLLGDGTELRVADLVPRPFRL